MDTEFFKKRLNDFKKPSIESLKKKHDEFTVNLRKNKRKENINKKRYEFTSIDENEMDNNDIMYLGICSDTLYKYCPELNLVNSEIQKLRICRDILRSTGIPDFILLEILAMLRMSLIVENNSPRGLFLDEGMIPVIVEYMSYESSAEIASEAVWCICNIAAGEDVYVREIYSCNVVTKLVDLLKCDNIMLIDNTLWTIANMLGENWEICEEFIGSNILGILSSQKFLHPDLSKSASFLLNNICKNESNLDRVQAQAVLELLSRLIAIQKPSCLWALSTMTNKSNDKVQLLIDSGLTIHAIEGLEMNETIQAPSLRVIGNILSGTNDQAQYILDQNILSILEPLLNSPKLDIIKGVYWGLSNIAAGTFKQRDILGNHPILKKSIEGLIHFNSGVRKEASTLFRNFTRLGCVQHKLELIEHGIFKVLSENIKSSETDCLINSLDTCKSLLDIHKYVDIDVLKEFQDTGCFKGIEDLTYHLNQEISSTANYIIAKYFSYI